MNIQNVQGAHLTATDRANVRALLAHPSYREGLPFRVGRSKTYTISGPDQGGTYRLVIIEPYRTDAGTLDERRYRSTFQTSTPKDN